MAFAPSSPRERVVGAVIAVLVQAAIGLALLSGFAVAMPGVVPDALKLFTIAPPPLPEKVVPPPVRSVRRTGRAAPPNLRATPKPITAPVPIVPIPVPMPIQAPPKAADGYAPNAGAAEVRGPGTGAGGEGDGLGGGGNGDGDGGGWREETPPRHIAGRLRDADFPDELADAGVSGTVSVRYVVEINGRVGDCDVTRSSGNRVLDALTCRLIRERFRFRPSLDGRGRPVESMLVEDHRWDVDP